MKGTIIFTFVIMVCMYMFLVPLSEETGNANLHGVSLVVGQFSSWVFWTWVFEIIEYKVTNKRKVIKEL